MLPPRSICIAGSLLIAGGVASIMEMISDGISGHFRLNLGFVFIPIGYGLLMGRSSSRGWALFFSCASILFVLGFCVLFFFGKNAAQTEFRYPDTFYVTAARIPWIASSLYVILTLRGNRHKAWFAAPQQDPSASRSLAWSAGILSAVLLSLEPSMNWWINETNRLVQPFRVVVSPYDMTTGKGLTQLNLNSIPGSTGGDKHTYPKMHYSFQTVGDGMGIVFFGVATHPVKITLRSIGYRDAEIVLTGWSEGEMRVGMWPEETKKPE